MPPMNCLGKLLDELPPAPGRARYKSAIAKTAKKFRMSERTVERRWAFYKDVVRRWIEVMKATRQDTPERRERYLNILKAAIAEGRDEIPKPP